MNRHDLLVICTIFIVAFSLRCYDFSYPGFKWLDEGPHVQAASNYWNNGQFEPDRWEHPPLRHTILYGFLQVFGDTPAGWRMRNIFFGALAAALTYMVARNASGSIKTGALAGVLLATDPLHIVLSRFTFCEVYGAAFFLAAIVLYQMHKGKCSLFILSAFFMGCALATKWYYVPGWILVSLLALRENRGDRNLSAAFFTISTYTLIPICVYICSYYQWFGRGYSLGEFLEFVFNAYYSLQQYTQNNYDYGLFFLKHLSAKEWFIRPIILGEGTYFGADQGEFILFMNNIPIWIFTFPALAALTYVAIRKKCIHLALPALLFIASYSLFLIVRRPAFLYSVTFLLPFAFTAISYCVVELTDKYLAKLFYVIIFCIIAWNMYLYPLVTAKKINIGPYRYLLKQSDAQIH